MTAWKIKTDFIRAPFRAQVWASWFSPLRETSQINPDFSHPRSPQNQACGERKTRDELTKITIRGSSKPPSPDNNQLKKKRKRKIRYTSHRRATPAQIPLTSPPSRYGPQLGTRPRRVSKGEENSAARRKQLTAGMGRQALREGATSSCQKNKKTKTRSNAPSRPCLSLPYLQNNLPYSPGDPKQARWTTAKFRERGHHKTTLAFKKLFTRVSPLVEIPVQHREHDAVLTVWVHHTTVEWALFRSGSQRKLRYDSTKHFLENAEGNLFSRHTASDRTNLHLSRRANLFQSIDS